MWQRREVEREQLGDKELRETTVGVYYVRDMYVQKLKIRNTLQCQKNEVRL